MNLLLISSLCLLGMLWHYSMRAREKATRIAKGACREMDVKLWDDSVSLHSVRPQRNQEKGGWELLRTYEFQFVNPEMTRFRGFILMAGERVESLMLDTDHPVREGEIPDNLGSKRGRPPGSCGGGGCGGGCG